MSVERAQGSVAKGLVSGSGDGQAMDTASRAELVRK